MAFTRNAPVYAESKKIAEISKANYALESGDEAQFTDAGVVWSNGQITSKISCDCIVPVAGMTTRLIAAFLQKQTVRIGIVVDGQMHQIPMRPMKAEYDTDAKTGALTGKFEFNGAQPDVTG
jgi:hypothetical protein